jgi:hypothetical protein
MAALDCFDPNYLAPSTAKGDVVAKAISKIFADSVPSLPFLLAHQHILHPLAGDSRIECNFCSSSVVVLCTPSRRSDLYLACCSNNYLL